VRIDDPYADAQLAGLYDAFSFDDDIDLYLELAQREGGRVLEVASGSGRVLVPLAKRGFTVVGIDSSRPMLELCKDKLAQHGAAAELHEGDMRSFELAQREFDLAILAVKSFAYLLDTNDQLRCLRTVAAHLRPGGLLAIDLLHPRPDWVGAAAGWLRQDLVQRSEETGVVVSRVESVVRTDLARQVRVIRSTYEVIGTDGKLINKRLVEWPYRYTYRFEAEHMLERTGFEVESMYGGYAREPFTTDSMVMLFLARKR
jgi:SAM-dependent methyltransferase